MGAPPHKLQPARDLHRGPVVFNRNSQIGDRQSAHAAFFIAGGIGTGAACVVYEYTG